MIQRKDLFSIPFYNKTQYTGSNLGMRYRIEKHVEDDSTTLLATWWPGPYCFTATPDEQKRPTPSNIPTKALVRLVTGSIRSIQKTQTSLKLFLFKIYI